MAEEQEPFDSMLVMTDDEINALLNGRIRDGDIVDVFSPVEPISIDFGNNSNTQQQNPSEYLHKERNVSGGSVLITPEETTSFNTLITQYLWPLQVTSFDLSTTFAEKNRGQQTTMASLLNSQMEGSSGTSKEVPILQGTASGSAEHHRTISNLNETCHLSCKWLERCGREWMANSPNSGKLLSPSMYANSTMNVRSKNKQKTDVSSSSRGKTKLFSANTSMGTIMTTHSACTDVHTTSIIKDGLRNQAPMSSIRGSGSKDVLSTSTSIPAINTSFRDDALRYSSSHFKNSRFFEPSAPFPYSTNVVSTNTRSSDHYVSGNLALEDCGYIKAWEGSITSRGTGITLFVSQLVAYRSPEVPEKIFENWPKMMQLNHLVSPVHLHNSQLEATKHHLVLTVLEPCSTWELMNSMNLRAFVELPGQTLMLSILEDKIFENKILLTGTVYEGIIPVDRNQTFVPFG